MGDANGCVQVTTFNDECTVLGAPVLRFEGTLPVAQKSAPDGAVLAFACNRSSACPGLPRRSMV